MKLTISRRSAAWAAFAACAARVFLALAVDMPSTHNGAWLSALMGGLMALPLALALDALSPSPRGASTPLFALLFLATLFDAAAVLSGLARSAGYLSLNRAGDVWLLVPLGGAALWCVHSNGDAVGRGAMVWARLFFALALAVVVLQASHYRPRWLAPLLGDGWKSIILGGVRAAGAFVPASSVLLLGESSGEARRRRGVAWAPLCAGMITAALLILGLMMTPTMTGVDGWLARLDALLTNGRGPLYLQLPMIALWYAGLLHLLACDCFASAALLQRIAPGVGGHVCGTVVSVAATLWALLTPPDSAAMAALYPWMYVVAAASAALAAMTVASAGKDAGVCAS